MRWPTVFLAILFMTPVAAHDGVKNPVVKARMHTMMQTKEAFTSLAKMSKGAEPFDAARARKAVDTLMDTAARTPAAFAANETDPKSEAKPEIWENLSDFNAKAEKMGTAAQLLDVSTLDALRSGMPALGGTCLACHDVYRIEKN